MGSLAFSCCRVYSATQLRGLFKIGAATTAAVARLTSLIIQKLTNWFRWKLIRLMFILGVLHFPWFSGSQGSGKSLFLLTGFIYSWDFPGSPFLEISIHGGHYRIWSSKRLILLIFQFWFHRTVKIEIIIIHRNIKFL